MKKVIFLVLITLLTKYGYSQNQQKLDSLKAELKKFEAEKSNYPNKKDTLKALLMDRIGEVYFKMNKYSEALENYESALKIQKELKNNNGIAVSNTDLGLLNSKMGLFKEALKFEMEALNAREDLGNSLDIGLANEVIANEYENLHDKLNALIYHQSALKKFLLAGDKKCIARAYHNVGRQYYYSANNKRALENEHKSLTIAEEIGDTILEKKVNISIQEIDKAKKVY